MKKTLFIIALLSIAIPALADPTDVKSIDFSKPYAMIVPGRPAPGGAAALTCNTTTAHWSADRVENTVKRFGYSTDEYANGQASFQPDATHSICRVGFLLTSTGTVSGKYFRVRIFTHVWSSGWDIDLVASSSSIVQGVNGWSNTEVNFDFSTPYEINSSTSYAIMIMPTDAAGDNIAADSTNYVSVSEDGNEAGLSGQGWQYTSAYASYNNWVGNTNIKIYVMQ